MIVKVLWVIMWCIIIFALGFFTGCSAIRNKVYEAMHGALNSISVKDNGVDYVRGVLYICDKIDYGLNEKEDEECQ